MSEDKKRRGGTTDGQAVIGSNDFFSFEYVERARRKRNALRLRLVAKALAAAAKLKQPPVQQQRQCYLTVNGNTRLTGYSHIVEE